MGISELRRARTRVLDLPDMSGGLGRDLVKRGTITKSDAARARTVATHCDASLDRILRSEGLVAEEDLLQAHARRLSGRMLTVADLAQAEPLDAALDPAHMLRNAYAPLRGADGRQMVAVADPEAFRAVAARLPAEIAGLPRAAAPRHAIQDRVATWNRDQLTHRAQARVPEVESCRGWGRAPGRRMALTLVALAGLAWLTLAFPSAVFGVLAFWAIFTLVISAALKVAAFVAGVTSRDDQKPYRAAPPPDGPLPKVSVLVPLFRETEIAHALIARLTRLTYPKCLLDVVLVLEEEDELTRETLAGIDLPDWIRPVIVPDGQPRTKPRAMNYALDFCEGDIIGIFDAEDAPEPDQITAVARRFRAAPQDLVCLQGILDYYNPFQNWLARCFTIEYATWFRVMLPGMARLGFAIPLGGTTLYFRRDALESLGGWDAHNVTEDADLGFRLARHGYRTEMIGTVTGEEANCRPWPWIKQRSRWLKGYMTTYLVNMRRPGLLLRQLGPWKFLGFQAHFVTALSQFLLAPVLWSFWLVLLGLPHPLAPLVPWGVMVTLGSVFLLIEVINIIIFATAVSGPRHRHLLPWTPSMHFYAPLGAVAAYKALYELAVKPFFWDKTAHGLSLGPGAPDREKTVSDRAVDLSRIELEPSHESL